MESLIKALGLIPKWFSTILLLCVLALVVLGTGSIIKTIVLDCGTISIAGTNIGGNCNKSDFRSTTEWRYVSFLDENGMPAPKRNGRSCQAIVEHAMKGVFDNTDKKNRTRSGWDSRNRILWYKLEYKNTLYDLLHLCHTEGVMIIVNGAVGWPIESFLWDASNRIQKEIGTDIDGKS